MIVSKGNHPQMAFLNSGKWIIVYNLPRYHELSWYITYGYQLSLLTIVILVIYQSYHLSTFGDWLWPSTASGIAKALSTIRFQLGVASPVLAEKALAETMGKPWENAGFMGFDDGLPWDFMVKKVGALY